MIIAYDVSHIQRGRGGIGGYTLALLRRILEADTVNRYILHGWSYSIDRNVLKGLVTSRCSLSAKHIPGILKRAYWDMVPFVPLKFFTGTFDIFHSGDQFFPPVGRRKLVVTLHDLLARSHPQFFEESVLRRDHRTGSRIGRADAVIVQSRFTRDQLLDSGMVSPDRIHVIPPPIPSEFAPEEGAWDTDTRARYDLVGPYILSIGTIEPRKNILALVSAFENLCGDGARDVDLVIAGKMGWMSVEFPDRLRRSPFARRIRWLQYVPESDLAPLYRGAMCLVYPSFAEGYGKPVAEAMACGIPVVTSRSSGMAEAAGDAAILIDPHSIEEITGAMSLLVHDEGARARLRIAGVERAIELRNGFDPGAVIRLYSSLSGQ